MRLLPLQCLLLAQMGAHDRVEVAVRLGPAGDGGRRRAGDGGGGFLYGVVNAFCALDVSLTLLQRHSSDLLKRTHAADGGLTLGCLSSDSRRPCLLFSTG